MRTQTSPSGSPSLHAVNRARSRQARVAVREHLRSLVGCALLDHPDDPAIAVLVGPPGVVAVDGRAWSGGAELRDGRLLAGGRDRTDVLSRLGEHLNALRTRLPGLDVRGAIVLVDPPPGQQRLVCDDVAVLGLDELADGVLARPRTLAPEQVAASVQALRQPVPAEAPQPVAAPSGDRTSMFDRAFHVLYLSPWRGRRLVLVDRGGRQLGRQEPDGAVAVLAPDLEALTRALLAAATPSGLQLLPSALPKTPVELLGRALVGRFAGLYKATLVGQRWSKGRADRLYGTFASPTEGVVALGYVDLTTGDLHPSGSQAVAKDRRVPADYLRRLRDDMPTTL